jgi:hypothetical protein
MVTRPVLSVTLARGPRATPSAVRKALLPIDVTVDGITTDVTPVLFSKADTPIEVTELSITTAPEHDAPLVRTPATTV